MNQPLMPIITLALVVSIGTQAVAASESHYAEGVRHLRAKQATLAQGAFEQCLATAKGEQATQCQWELGWAFWLQQDWPRVVVLWEKVLQQNPQQEGGAEYLEQAKAQLALLQQLAATNLNAAPTFKSAASNTDTIRLRSVGDLMIGTLFPEGYLPPDDARGTFSAVKPLLQDADITFGNLEGPICDKGETKKCNPNKPAGRCYAFHSPSRYVALYQEAGFDVMSTANNHAEDFGVPCRLETERLLVAHNIAHTGRPGQLASLKVNRLKIGFIGFHTSMTGHYLNDHQKAEALVRNMAREHDIVVVSFHGGAEGNGALHVPHKQETFYGENRGHLRKFSRLMIDAGADLILGHGPHVLRGMEIYQGRLIAYSLGNFATYGRFNLSKNLGVGAILETTLAKDGSFVRGKIFATKQVGRGVPALDPSGKAINLVRMLSESDFPKTGVLVAQDGSLAKRGSSSP